jgi:hypothetical protein
VNVGRIRASLALLSLLAVGAWVGSSVAHGASTEQAPLPGASVPAVTATVPLVGPVTTPSVGVSVPAVDATVPAVSVTVPAVSATVPAVTVTAPVVGPVTTPSATVSTPPVRVTTPAVTTTAPVASAVGAVTTAASQLTKTVVATANSTVTAATKSLATTASKATAATPTATTAASPNQAVTTTASTPAAGTLAARARAARARRLRLARHRRAVRAHRTTRTTPTTSTAPVASTPSLSTTQTFVLTPPALATQTILGPGDGASLVLTTPATSTAAVELPFLPIVAAANFGPRRLLSSGPGASSYRLDAVPFTAPLLTGGFNGKSRLVAALLPQLSLAAVVKPAATAPGASPEPVAGGHSSVAPAAGGRGIGVELPIIGRIGISGGGYQFGRSQYPLASVGGIVTTALLSLGALAAISALFAGVSAGAAVRRRRRAEASATPVREPTSEPGIDEGWDL